MSGPLNSIFAACNTLITANLVAASIAPTYAMTGADRRAEAAPPRVIWMPQRATYGAPQGQGGDVTVDSAKNMNIAAAPPRATRFQNVDVDIWGADRDTVELMHDAVVSAVWDTVSGPAFEFIEGDWLEPEAFGKDGEIFRLTLQFKIPVLRVDPSTTTATITSIPETPQVNH